MTHIFVPVAPLAVYGKRVLRRISLLVLDNTFEYIDEWLPGEMVGHFVTSYKILCAYSVS